MYYTGYIHFILFEKTSVRKNITFLQLSTTLKDPSAIL